MPQFSSLPRNRSLSTLPGRSSALRTTSWRAGAPIHSKLRLSSSSVRYGSWYAPWTWGSSSTQDTSFQNAHATTAPASPVSPADLAAKSTEPVVTSSTPELAPAGIDKAAAVDSTTSDSKLIEDVLGTDSSAVDTSLVDPTQVISYWGHMKDLGLDYGWGPSAFFQSILELTYVNLDVGWTGAIVVSAFILRNLLFWGFQRRSSNSLAKMAAMQPMMQPLLDEMEEAKRKGDDDKAQALKMKQKAILNEVGGDVGTNVGSALAQMVFGYGAFNCLRGMANFDVQGMSSESLLWISNLTVPDPYYIIPVLTGGIMYVVIKRGGETGVAKNTSVSSMQKNLQIGLPIMMAGITAWQPAAVQLYFLTGSILGGITGHALKQPTVRRILRIRQVPNKESNELYKKVIKGEVKLEKLRGADGKVRYQAPKTTTESSSTRRFTSRASSNQPYVQGVTATLKPGLVLPPHMAPPSRTAKNSDVKLTDRDHDFEDGMPEGVGEKWDWIKRNYKPSFILKRTYRRAVGDTREARVVEEDAKKRKQKEAAERYELERKRRFEGR
ncbi:hypothetical protein DM02DRAFT_516724 [Periconia macrospinosa]|uniref:Membrane insertase YidC/Oxa/ALB C-terminal domain-containing protein n=1 Tax=Periconia macrospinosa TaxID=97972 RepID=A0A2V1E5T5_9PLEO|nr:hypothetical protein DM02DRAFT_516724 [Periconia macrospinosa]